MDLSKCINPTQKKAQVLPLLTPEELELNGTVAAWGVPIYHEFATEKDFRSARLALVEVLRARTLVGDTESSSWLKTKTSGLRLIEKCIATQSVSARALLFFFRRIAGPDEVFSCKEIAALFSVSPKIVIDLTALPVFARYRLRMGRIDVWGSVAAQWNLLAKLAPHR